jgi:hypothetical protein
MGYERQTLRYILSGYMDSELAVHDYEFWTDIAEYFTHE